MSKRGKKARFDIFHTAVLTSLILLGMIMLFLANGERFSTVRSGDFVKTVRSCRVRTAGGTRKLALPAVLDDLPHGSTVEISYTLPSRYGNRLFFGTVYAPLKIYVDDQLVYSYGDEETYPAFFLDPPTNYTSITLPVHGPDLEDLTVKMVYTSPQERHSLSIHSPMFGSDSEIFYYMLKRYGVSFILSVFFLFLGALLILVSLFFLQTPKASSAILLTAVMALSAGSWQFGENTLSVYLLRKPYLLYVMDFVGLFILVIPLYMMAILYLDMQKSRLLRAVLYLMEISALAAFLLQATGTVSFHRSLYWFHVLLPAAICILTGRTLYEAIKKKNRNAGYYLVSLMVLLAAALSELINYYLHLNIQFTSFFQLGLFLFMCIMAFFSALYIRNMADLQISNLKLENANHLQEQIIEAQKSKNIALLSHYEEIRKQRHDIRHHLRTIDDMLKKGKGNDASDYIHSIEGSIPGYISETYCDNPVVNSTLCYYAQKASEERIRILIHVQVPAENPAVTDAGLCVLCGNLLENAIEACRRMTGSNRYINLRSRVAGDMLFISMENSYEGAVRSQDQLSVEEKQIEPDEGLLSSKHEGSGRGLRSIASICSQHQGSVEIRVKDNCFVSEICIRL